MVNDTITREDSTDGDGPIRAIFAGHVADAHGVEYHPWTDGWAIGFRCVDTRTGREEYVYLNPSSDSDDEQSNAFLYHEEGSPSAFESPIVYVDVFAPDATD